MALTSNHRWVKRNYPKEKLRCLRGYLHTFRFFFLAFLVYMEMSDLSALLLKKIISENATNNSINLQFLI